VTTPTNRALALALALPFLLCACGDDGPKPKDVSPFPGTWVLDAPATADRMKDIGVDPDVKAIERSAFTIEIKADGTYRGQVSGDDGLHHATGTWTAKDDDVSLVVVAEDGKPPAKPDTKTATLHEGRLLFDASETTQPLVLRRR
jgi:hypothetical protein